MRSLASLSRFAPLGAWLALVVLAVGSVVLLGDVSHLPQLTAVGAADWRALAGVALMGLIDPIVMAKSKAQLAQIVDPQVVAGGQSEAVPWVLYDTQLFTSAATTTQTFYATQQNDRTLSNLLQAGALTDPQYFEIFNLGFDVLTANTSDAGGATGRIDDIQRIMLVGRPIFTLTISDKNYGPFPLSFLHTSGGAVGMGWGTFTAEESIQYGNNSLPDGGWNWRGSVVIPPKVGFSVTVQWAAAQTLTGGNPQLRFWMAGVLHRRVL